MHHRSRKAICILPTGKIETVHLARVPPLMECSRSLIVLKATDYATIYNHLHKKYISHRLSPYNMYTHTHIIKKPYLMVVEFPAYDSERVVLCVMVDVNFTKTRTGA